MADRGLDCHREGGPSGQGSDRCRTATVWSVLLTEQVTLSAPPVLGGGSLTGSSDLTEWLLAGIGAVLLSLWLIWTPHLGRNPAALDRQARRQVRSDDR